MSPQRTRAMLSAASQQTNTEEEKDIVLPRAVIKMTSPPSVHRIQAFPPTAKEAKSEHSVQLQTVSKSQSRPKAAAQPNPPQSQTPPQPPAMVSSEVHSKAQSMARSRLEKARLRLQGRIQQAIKLFGGKELSESQAKKKQKALKILQPALLEEFLGAVEGFGAFCSGPQLQDLTLLSDSVRKQWEDVCREMAGFVLTLKSKMRERKHPFSVLQCDMCTNTLHEETDQTGKDSLQLQQVVTEGAASAEEHIESLRGMCETLMPSKSSCLDTHQLTQTEVQETQTRDTSGLPQSRGRQPEGRAPLSPACMSPGAKPSNGPSQKQSPDGPQQPSAIARVVSVRHGHIPQLQRQDAPAQSPLTPSKDCRPEQRPKSSLRAKEQLLTVHLRHVTESSQPAQTQAQAVVRSNSVEIKQEARWTVIPDQAAQTRAEPPSEQDAPQRVVSLEKTCELMDSATGERALITEKLNRILGESVDVSSLTLAKSTVFSDLKEIDDTLQAEMRNNLEQSSEEERRRPGASSPPSVCQVLRSNVHHLRQLRRQLEEVQSAARALDRFLATLRDAKAEIPTLLAKQHPGRQKNEEDWEQERHIWQATLQMLQPAMEQSDVVDRSLKAVGMTLSMDGTLVTCQEVMKTVSKHILDQEKELVATRRKQMNEEAFPLEKDQMQSNEEFSLMEMPKTRTGSNSGQQIGAQEHSSSSVTEESVTKEELGWQVKRMKQDFEGHTNTQRTQTWRSEGDILKIRDKRQRRSSQIKKAGEQKESWAQRTAVLLSTLRKTKTKAEQLRLPEPTLPALQQRTRALTELESPLAGLFSEAQHLRDASSQAGGDDLTREVEDLWEETKRAVTDRLEQCSVLTEMLKRFQTLRGELSGTLQRAESTVSEQASYMGKDNLQRLHTKVQDTKAELTGLGDNIEEVRGVCRQLHAQLRQMPGCTAISFESESEALMDHWLDLSERTDLHLENLHLCLSLWDGVLQLGADVGSWTDNKLAVFAQCPSFQMEEDIETLQREILTQEENIQRFHRRATEIQMLLQSSEFPLELQVVETQMRKKMEQLKELASEAEDVYKQMVATKGQITGRMAECFNSLEQIQNSLLSLTAPDVATVLAKLKDLCLQLHTQDEQAASLLEDGGVIASIAGTGCLQSLSSDGIQLQEKVRNTHQLFSEVEEQTEKNINDLDRLQTEKEHLELWLQAAEGRAAKAEDANLLQEETLQQSVRTELLTQLVSSLQSSSLRQSVLLEQSTKLLGRWSHFQTETRRGSEEPQCSQSSDTKVFQAFPKSTQPCIEDLRQDVDSSVKSRTLQEQRRRHAKGSCSRREEGLSNEEHFLQLLQECHHKLTSLQDKLSVCQAQKESPGGLRADALALQITLKDLEENVGSQSRSHEVPPDISQLKQQWDAMQDCDKRLSELADRVNELQRTRDSTQEMLPEDVISAIGGLVKDLDSLRSAFEQRNLEVVENTAETVRAVITQLQKWIQTAQAEPSSPSQAALDEGFHLQNVLQQLLTEHHFLLSCLGAEVTTVLERKAAAVLSESQPVLRNLSERVASLSQERLESHDLLRQDDKGSLRNEETADSVSLDIPSSTSFSLSSSSVAASKEDSDRNLVDDENKTKGNNQNHPFSTELVIKLPTQSNEGSDVRKQEQACPLIQKESTAGGFIELNKGLGSAPIQASCSEIPNVLRSQDLTGPPKINLRADTASEDEGRMVGTETQSIATNPFPTPGKMSALQATQSETFRARADAPEQDKHDGDSSGNPDKVFTVVLDLQAWDIQQSGHFGTSCSDVLRWSERAELFNAKQAESSNTGLPEEKEERPPSAKSLCKKNHEALTSKDKERLTSSKSVAERQHTDRRVTETTRQSVKREETAGFCLPGGETVEGSAQTEDASREMDKIPTDSRVRVTSQNQIRESMDPERTAPVSPAALAAGQQTGGSPDPCKHRFTMQDILSEIQSLVERSTIINRTPHTGFNWYLKSLPGEADIQLVRSVQQVLACRYQPAQLSVTVMAKQLEEAQELRRHVQEQVSTLNNDTSVVLDPNGVKRAEKRRSAALLDASATVQVKATQLAQVRQYHLQMKLAKAFLEVVAAEREKMSLNALGSSAFQAEKLGALQQTMELKNSLMEDLLCISGQLSAHLSDAESSGALLAQLGDVQEEWRLQEGSIKRALRHASNSARQASLLCNQAEQLKAKLEALLKCESCNLRAFQLICQTTDLKICNQLYLRLKSQTDALIKFPLGQKEKDEIGQNLQGLRSLFDACNTKLDSFSCGGNTSGNIHRQLADLIIWAKQAESRISTGQKLALFPEEARIQIAEMKKFQTEILSRRTEVQDQVEKLKSEASGVEKVDTGELKTVTGMYEALADSLGRVLKTMKNDLSERERLLGELANLESWLAETHAQRDPCTHVENVSTADIRKLEEELKNHKLATVEIENQLKLVDQMSDSCATIAMGLSPGESRYLVNRLSGLWTELDGLLAHEKATSWELEELIHEWTSSNDELFTIQGSLKQISADLEQQKFPLTQDTLLVIAHMEHMLMEHQCQVQELQHCQEAKRSPLLCSIGELQERCKALIINASEQDKYLHLIGQMKESRDIVKRQIEHAKNKAVSAGERFRLCQALLVELPLVKTQCQEAADQLEAIANELNASELNSERERIHGTVETLESWEHSATDDIKNLEAKLLLGLRFDSEFPGFIKLLHSTRERLEAAEPVCPEERAIDTALLQYWVIWRNVESGMRVLEGLAQKEKVNLKNYKDLFSLREVVIQECHSWMDSLSQARESLKDYQWAAQGAIGFLHNAETTFLSAPGGFLDCTEEQRQTHQALEVLEDGFQAHISHLVERVPQQTCLSRPETEALHISVLSRLLVGRAVLEAQAQLRLECLQRCEMGQQSHRKCHEDIRQCLSGLEERLSECAAERVASYDKCAAQQRRAQLLMDDLRRLAWRIEDLRAGCPVQGCGVGKDGGLGALWRRWASLRRGAGLLMARSEQRGEEWKDIATSMEQCCSCLASLQAEVPDSSAVSFAQEAPQKLLAQAEMYQAGLEQEQQAILSLERRLEHALSLSSSHESVSPGPVGKTLVKIQENVRSLKERALLVVAAAQSEEKERHQIQEEIRQLEKQLVSTSSQLELCSNPSERQELKKDLCSLKIELRCIMENVQRRFDEIPVDIEMQIQEVQASVQKAEEILERNSPVKKLAYRLHELSSGLEEVKALLEKRSSTVTDAQNVLKHVWDELDSWHSSLMLLENEVQDLAEEQPEEAQLLMDQLTEPLQLYQNAAHMAEHRTTFLSRIPACLKEFEDILHRATCWLDEAQSWLKSPCSFTTARSLQNHAKSLQLVLEDSDRIRRSLQDFRSMLAEIDAVCDIRRLEERLNQSDAQVHEMQCSISDPLTQLLQAYAIVEVIEADVKIMEKNVPKIRTILSSMDVANIPLTEHLHNRQVILASLQSMLSGLEDIERCKGELHIAEGVDDLQVFSRAKLLLQPLQDMDQLTREQLSLLENMIRSEEETSTSPDPATVSDFSEEAEQLHRSAQRHFDQQEAFEVSKSEEEEDEEAESCHSSSSDTLTCSIPEDPEDTMDLLDGQIEDMAEIQPQAQVMEQQSSAQRFSPEAETSSKGAEARFFSSEPGREDNSAFSPKSVMLDSPDNANKAEVHFKVAAPALQESPKQETSDHPQTDSAAEETRLIPSRPITPFSAKQASDEFREEKDENTLFSPTPHLDQDAPNTLEEHQKAKEGSVQTKGLSEPTLSSAAGKDDDKECQSWGQLLFQISEKLTILRKLQPEHQSGVNTESRDKNDKPLENPSASTGSASAVLQQTRESIAVLQQTVTAAGSSDPGENEKLFHALRRVLLCLHPLTDFLLAPAGAGGDADPQLRLLQLECVSAELLTLSGLLGKMEPELPPALSKDEPDAYRCLTSLQDGLQKAQFVLTSLHNQLTEDSGLSEQLQEPSSTQMCLLYEIELEQNEIFPNLKNASNLESVLGRYLSKCTGGEDKPQHASRSLLQGITRLLELGEECLTERRARQAPSCSKLQAVLRRHKNLLQVLKSQLAFVQYLFHHEPNVLRGKEDEWKQLEVRAKALNQLALEQEVASQTRLQEWVSWEDRCARLVEVLNESEAFISSGEPEGADDEELVQRRLNACEQTLLRLEESRALLGPLLDDGKLLRAEAWFAAPVGQTGGALELQWKSIYSRTEQEIQRCQDIQESRARFQADFASVSGWLLGANVKTLFGLAVSSGPSQESVQSNLVKLLDFSLDMEAMYLLKTSVSQHAARLLYLTEADCPALRSRLTQLEDSWSQLTSDLSEVQDRLQQRLLAAQQPLKLISEMESWLKKTEARLSQEKEQVLEAKNGAQVTEVLQHYQVLRTVVAKGQILLDFLFQSGPQMVGANVQALRSKGTKSAEKLGSIQLQWLLLQRELEIQIHEAEQIHRTCADRERSLQRLLGWTEQQKKQLKLWKRPSSQTLACKALQECEAVLGKVNEVSDALQKLKTTRVQDEKDKRHPSDVSFWKQADSVCHACGDLSHQVEVLRPTLQRSMEEWACFHKCLRDFRFHTNRVRCSLQRDRAHFFSLKQVEGYSDLLQNLQVTVAEGEELLVALEKSHQRLAETLHHLDEQALSAQVEDERKRWKDTVQEIKDEYAKTGKTLSFWQKYARLSDGCSHQLQHLWHEWEKLWSSSLSPEKDAEAMLCSVKTLQEAAEDLQAAVGDVLEVSKPLTGQLEPCAAKLIQSKNRLLSRDSLLLNQAVMGRKRFTEEDLQQQKLYQTQVEAIVKQMEISQQKLQDSKSNTDCVQQVLLELSGLFPSLVNIQESGYVNLNNQERDRLHALSRQWSEALSRALDMNRDFHQKLQDSQNFEEKCTKLRSLQEKLELESVNRKSPTYSNILEMLAVHQRLQAEVIIGHRLLQGLLVEAVESMEKDTGKKRSELLAQVWCIKKSWINSVALIGQNWTLTKKQLHWWKIYRQGSKLLWKLLGVMDTVLPSTGPFSHTLHQLQSCTDAYQCVEESLALHFPVYSQTVEAGKHLCETVTVLECQDQVESELQALEEAWERTSSLLRRHRDQANVTITKWSVCQSGITNIHHELDKVKHQLAGGLGGSEELIQETELSLQRSDGGLKEVTTMKMELTQCVTGSDSALLEQQLELLHGQWEELCLKVSSHRQEIADRLNAWTIFNDKNKEFRDWLTQMENKVCHAGDLSIEEMVEKLKKDCMEEINLFSENKSHLKQLGEQLLLASDEAKQTQVRGSLQEVNQRWQNLFYHIEARVKKLTETLGTVQQLDKNMSNLRSWLSRIQAELSRPITYSVCHEREIQRRLAEQQELQRDIEQHTEGVASVLSLCDVLLRDEDAARSSEAESDSLQETSRSLDQRWRTICALALDRRLRIEETWSLWCKFLNDYSRFEDWLKMAERAAANPNSADVLFTVAKEELKKFEGFQRQVNERLTQLELINNQYRRLARENRTDRASQLKAMVHEGNRRWDALHRRVGAILRRLKYFTSQREEFEGTRESMLVWLTELDLQLTNVEHFSESDVHHKIQQLNSFQREITLNTERIDGLIVFGEGLIQRSSPQDAALIEDELEELHSYCQEVFSRLVRFHQRLSQPPTTNEDPDLSATTFSLESSLELIGRPWLGRNQGSLPATPTHLLTSPLERSGRETPVSVDSLPLEWDHTGDVGGSSSHEDDEEEDEEEEEGAYFSALSVSRRSASVRESPRWRSSGDSEVQLDTEEHADTAPALTSTPLKGGYLRLMSQCSGSIENLKRVSLILDDEEQPEQLGLTGLAASDKQSGVIERWELLRAQSRCDQQADPGGPRQLPSDLDDITSWLESVTPELERLLKSDPAAGIEDMEARAKELKEMQKAFAHYKSIMLAVNLRAEPAPELQVRLLSLNRDWSRACTGLQQWDASLRRTLMSCQEFHETLHSLLLWLAHAESQRYAVDISHPDTAVRALQHHSSTLTGLREELRARQEQQASLQALWSHLQPDDGAEESAEAQEKLHVTGGKLRLLLAQVERDLRAVRLRLDAQRASDTSQEEAPSEKASSPQRQSRGSSPPRSFFQRVLRAAFPLQLLLLLLLLLPCLIPLSERDPGCTLTNNFARSFYPMLRYTNGPPPT
ncbi:nesprin-2-like [Menidia menidia]